MAKLYSLVLLVFTQLCFATAEIGIIHNSISYNNSDTINIGDVNIGSSQGFLFTIKNSGADTLRINSFSQNSGTDFIVSQPLKAKLAFDSTTSVSFTFTPTCENDEKFTAVTINSNANNNPIFTLVIQGNSIDTEFPTITCPSNIEKCGVQTITYDAPIINDNCTLSNTPFLTGGIASSNTFPIGTTTQTFQITDGAGNLNQCSFDVTIYDAPSTSIITNSTETICDSTFTLTGNTPSIGIGYWERITNNGTINDSLSTSTLLEDIPYGNSKYSWNIKNGVCDISSDTITISRDVEPAIANAGDDQELCDNNSTILAGNSNGQWTKYEGNGTIDSPNSAITQVSFISPGLNKFVWTIPSVNSCPNSSDTITVNNSQKPQSGATAPDDNVCGTSDTVIALAPVVGTGEWFVLTGGATIQSPSDTFSIVQNLSYGENKFIWKISSGSCEAEQDTLTITRNEEVTAIAGSAQTVCADSVKLNATLPTVGTGQWIFSNSITVQNANDPKTIANNLSNSSNFFLWLVTNGACSDNDFVTVSYNDDITPSNAGEDQKICDANETNLDAQTAGEAAGSWAIVEGSATIDNISSENSIIRDIHDPFIRVAWEIAAFGCTSSYDTVTIIRDTVAPTIICPNDTTLYSSSSNCDVTYNFTEPVGTDDCPNSITTHEFGQGTGAAYSLGTHTNTYKVTDATFGLTNQCSFNITVIDSIKPTLDCDAIVQLNNDDGTCGNIYSFSLPTASDNCSAPVGGFIVTQTEGLSSGQEFPVGTTDLVFTTTDSSGNIGTCTTNVIVSDSQKPSITCPNDTAVYTGINDCEAIVEYDAPIATDNCPNFTTSLIFDGTQSGTVFPIGTTLVGYRVIDVAGKGASCTFNVTVIDTIKPEILCPSNTTIVALEDQCGNDYTFNLPSTSDNCSIKSTEQTEGPSSGDFFNLGTTSVTFITKDSSDNTNTCSFDVTVIDTTTPQIICPATITKGSEESICGAIVNYSLPITTDNCTSTTLTQTDNTGLLSGSTFPIGTTSITYTVSDTAGNNSSCSFDIIILDNENPTITCPSNSTINTDIGQCTGKFIFDSFIEGVNINDNCPNLSVTQSDNSGLSSGDNFPIGTTSLTFEVSDNSDNKASCTFDITVIDNELPTITCPNDTVLATTDGTCATNYNFTLPTFSDNCTSPTLSFVSGVEQGGTFNLGTTTVVYEVTDNNNNKNQCSFDVTVNDSIAPEISCQNLSETIYVGSNCKATYSFNINATDNCDDTPNISQLNGLITGASLEIGTYDYWFVAKDDADNISDTCKYIVTVEDNTSPSLSCQSNITKCAPQTITFTDPTVFDNCSSDLTVNQTNGLTSGDLFPIGVNTITYEAFDDNNNRGTCSFDIIILDTSLVPQINGGDTIEVCDTIIPLTISNTSVSIDHQWAIINGQGKLSDTIGYSTTLDSVSYRSNVTILLTSTFTGCTTKTDTSLIQFKSPPEVANINSSYLLCDISELTINSSTQDAETFKWEQLSGLPVAFDHDSLSSITISGFDNNDETYSFSFTASTEQCRDTVIEFSVTASLSPYLTVSEDTAVYFGETVPLEVIPDQDFVSLSWYADSTFISSQEEINVSPLKTTTYHIFASNIKGCNVNDSINVVYHSGIKIYTGVTPNDDNINDTWTIRGITQYPDSKVEVFTQWGQKVYNSISGYEEPWEATHNGNPVPFGVYYYIIDLNNGSEKETGTITVLK